MMFVSCGKGCHPTCADPSPDDCSDVCTEGCYCQPGAAPLYITILMLLTLSKAMRNNLHMFINLSPATFFGYHLHIFEVAGYVLCIKYTSRKFGIRFLQIIDTGQKIQCIYFTFADPKIVNDAQNISCEFWDVCPNKPIPQIIYETTI